MQKLSVRNSLSILGSVGLAAFLSLPFAHAEDADATDVDALFQQAMEELEGGDLELATTGFEAILWRSPELDRVRMELALAHLRSFDYAKAESIAREVLEKPETPDSVKVRIREFLGAIEAQKHPHQWTPYFSVGFKYDDNVNVGPSSTSIPTAGGILTLAQDDTPKEDGAWVVMGGIGHTLRTGETFRIAGRTAAFFWQSGGAIYRHDYFSENDYDLTVASVNTGPTLLAARKWPFQSGRQIRQYPSGYGSPGRLHHRQSQPRLQSRQRKDQDRRGCRVATSEFQANRGRGPGQRISLRWPAPWLSFG
uniref:Tetratricopeptide repeat-containing protein n=1 Tax=Candidatus Kentrum sp. UNK TaxID=2126344 RepID=A0A451ARX2_9GAMM|nr:MAG: hypothetical protein BECKUNK1418G_GA0071005_100823 [Candidatus Kentron sp. UNK]VFK68806.1 MAG: hypothetical protein BECKUNK1418H_GA0071006_100632 [Candidatus Kentron sp. UNK]